VPPDRRADEVERRVENVFAMFSPAQSVIDDQANDDAARLHLAVGNIFAPQTAPVAVAIHPLAGIRPIGAGVPDFAVCLVEDVIGRSPRYPGRLNQRWNRPGAAKKSYCFINRGNAFLGAEQSPIRQDEDFALKTTAHFLEQGRVNRRLRPGKIDLADDRRAVIRLARGNRGDQERKERKDDPRRDPSRERGAAEMPRLTLGRPAATFPAPSQLFR